MNKTLVTGGAGFIDSGFIRWVVSTEPGVEVLNLCGSLEAPIRA